MARIINYEQDEDKPFGVGTFKLDDGSDYYMDDAPRANSVLEELYGKDDFASQVESESTNIAERGSVDRKREELDTKQKLQNAIANLAGAPEPNRPFGGIDVGPRSMSRAVAGPGGEGLDERSAELGRELDRASGREEPEPEQDEPRPAPSPEELQRAEAARRYGQAASLVSPVVQGNNPRALGQGVRVDKNYSRKGGLPMAEYNQQSQDRVGAFEATNTMIGRQYREDAAAADSQIQQLRAQAIAQKQANDKQELAVQQKEQKYREDRQWLEKDVDSFYDKAKPDPDRLFKERGAFGNIASAVAQFMGAYAAIITGSPNFANQILNKKVEQDIDAQMEDFRRGKMKRDGQLQRMADRGMSVEQMRSALRIQQELVLQKEIKAAALSEGTRESKQAAEALLVGRNEMFVKEENEFRTKALGEETVSGDMVRPTGPRMKTPLERQLEVNKLLGAQVEGEFLANGGAPAERAEERGAKKQGDLERRRTEFGNRSGVLAPAANEAQGARDRLMAIKEKYGHLPGVGTWDVLGPNTTLGEQRQKFLSAFGVDMAKAAGEVNQLLDVVEGAAVRANAGAQTEGDVKREAKAMRGPNQSEDQTIAGVERLTQRATAPLIELRSTYSDVVAQQDEERKKELVRRARERRDRNKAGQGSAGEDY